MARVATARPTGKNTPPKTAHDPSDPNLSLANQQKGQNLASFTLGDTPVNPLELTNVAATLGSHGNRCPPRGCAAHRRPDRPRPGL